MGAAVADVPVLAWEDNNVCLMVPAGAEPAFLGLALLHPPVPVPDDQVLRDGHPQVVVEVRGDRRSGSRRLGGGTLVR